MEIELKVAIITVAVSSVISIVTLIINYLITQRKLIKPLQIELMKLQYEKVVAPIHQILTINTKEDSYEKIQRVFVIVNENYSLTPINISTCLKKKFTEVNNKSCEKIIIELFPLVNELYIDLQKMLNITPNKKLEIQEKPIIRKSIKSNVGSITVHGDNNVASTFSNINIINK